MAIVLLVALCARAQPPAAVPAVPGLPALESVGDAARERVEALHADAVARAARGAPPVEIAGAVGALGQLYLAYELDDAAEAAFRSCLAATPDDARWSYYLGVVLEKRGDHDQALERFLHAREQRPDDAANLIRLGDLYLELDRLEPAREAYEAAMAADPSAAAASRYGLGQIAARDGEHRAAVEQFEAALELQPEADVIHYQLGQAYRRLGEIDRARDHLQKRGDTAVAFPDPLGDQVALLVIGAAFDALRGLAAAPEGFSERDFLGFAQSQFGEIEGATEELARALRIRAEEASALAADGAAAAEDRRVRGRIHYAVGGLLVSRGADQEAARHFEEALVLEPSLEDARVKLGNIAARSGDLAGAVKRYDEVLARNPDSADALLRRAAAFTTLERRLDAERDLTKLCELDPSNREALIRLATLVADRGDASAARTLFRRALELDLDQRERVGTHLRLAAIERELGAPDAAIAEYRAALELDPADTTVHFSLANTLGALERYDEAAAAYREILAVDARHEPARLGEATALVLAGKEAAARARLEEGVAAMPESLALTHALARLLAAANDRSVRDGERAVVLAGKALQAMASLEHAETLAMALAESGRPADAAAVQERLVAEAEKRGEATVLQRLRRNLELYRAGLACCDLPPSPG